MYQTTVLNESRKMHRDVTENCAKTFRTKKRCTNNQIEALTEYMSRHPEFAERFTLNSPKYNEEWKRLAHSLNMLGTKKTIASWKVTWKELKRNKRKRLVLSPSPDEEDWSMEPTNTKSLAQQIFSATSSISDSEWNSFKRSWNENESPKRRCTNMQQKILIKYMSSHPDLAKNRFSHGPVGIRRKTAEWDKLATLLNKLGTEKTVQQWKTSWRDIVRRSLKQAETLKYKATAEEVPNLTKSSNEDNRSVETSMPHTVWDKKIRVQKVLDIVKSTGEDEISEDDQESGAGIQESGEFIRENGENIQDSDENIHESGKGISENREDIHKFTRVESEHPCPMEDMTIFFERSLSPPSRLNSPDLENVQKSIDCDDIELQSQESPGQSDSGQMSPLRYDSDLNSDGESTGCNFDSVKVSTEKSSSTRVLSKQISNAVNCGHTAARDINQSSSMSPKNKRKSDDFLQKTDRKMVKLAGSTRAQTAALVDYMSQHIALAAAKQTGLDTFDPRHAEWRQLTKYLNKMGPAKSTLFWKITWQKLIVQSTCAKQDSEFDAIYRKVRDILGKIPSEENSPKTVPIEEISAQKPIVRQEMPVRCYSGQPSIGSEQRSPVLSELNIITELDGMEVEKKTSTTESDVGLKTPITVKCYPRYQNRRCLQTQKDALVNYIKSRPDMAYPPHSSATCEEWRRLSDHLNKIGHPKNSVRAWQITWQGMKRGALKAKKNRPHNKLSECVKNTLEVIEAYRRSNTTSSDSENDHDMDSSQRSRETGESIGNARCSKAQLATLVDYMTDNPALATSEHKGPCSEDPNIEGWRQLSKYLNRMGVARSITGWKQIWRDVDAEQSNEWDENISRKVLKVLGDDVIYRNNTELKIEIVEESSEMPPDFAQMSSDNAGRDVPAFNLISPVRAGQTSPDNLDQMSNRNCGSESSVMSTQARDFDTSTRQQDNDNEDDKQNILARVSRAQLKALVNYISNHPHMATNEQKGPAAMQKRNTEWRRLGRLLNSIGKAKTTDAWKHTWRKLKLRARTAKMDNFYSFNRRIYQRVLHILSLNNNRMESNAKSTWHNLKDSACTYKSKKNCTVTSDVYQQILRIMSPKDRMESNTEATERNNTHRNPRTSENIAISFEQFPSPEPCLNAPDLQYDIEHFSNEQEENNRKDNEQIFKNTCDQSYNVRQKGFGKHREKISPVGQSHAFRLHDFGESQHISNVRGSNNNVTARDNGSGKDQEISSISRDFDRNNVSTRLQDSGESRQHISSSRCSSNNVTARHNGSGEGQEISSISRDFDRNNVSTSLQDSGESRQQISSSRCSSNNVTARHNGSGEGQEISSISRDFDRNNVSTRLQDSGESRQHISSSRCSSNNVTARHNGSGEGQEISSMSHDFDRNNVSTRLQDSGESRQHISSSRCSSNNVTARHNGSGEGQEISSISRDFDRNNVSTRLQDSGKHSEQTSSIARDQFDKGRTKTQRQLNALVDYMYAERKRKNPLHSMWTLITKALNKMGPIKCTDGSYWKQKWLDLEQDVGRGSKCGIARCLDNARMDKVVEIVTKYPVIERESPSPVDIAEDTSTTTSNIQRKVAEALSRSFTVQRGSVKDKHIEKIGTSNVDCRTTGGDSIERSKEDEESSATATSMSNRDTNSLLKELIVELKRSNELKVKQNGLLQQLVNKFSADVPKSSHCSKLCKQTDAYTAPVLKREVEDLTEDYCINTRNSERSEEHSDAYIQDRSSHKNKVDVERSLPRVTATAPQKSAIPVISKVGTTSSSKKEIRTVDISRLMKPSFKPLERAGKLKKIVKIPKVNLLRLTDGTMMVMPGTKLPVSSDEYQTFVVGSVKHAADSETVPQNDNVPEGFESYEF